MELIKTEHLSKYYGKARGIIDLNLCVKEGDFFGFIGPNGAGKSTTIRLLLGLIRANSGTVKIFNQEVSLHTKEILSRIGYMPSETNFYDRMKVEEMITYAAKLYRKDCSIEANRLCERFQVDKKKRIEDLSLGNRKKVSIVCAMQHMADLYILDEATSGLDPLMQKEFFDLLAERNKNGATIFLSSHVLSEVQENCRTVAMVKEGKLISVNHVEELMKNAAKKVSIQGKGIQFKLDGMADIKKEEDKLTFLYYGAIPKLLEKIYQLPIKDISITEPGLEEIFLHFYEKEAN